MPRKRHHPEEIIQHLRTIENGYCESFNGKMRYELLDGEIFFSLKEAQVVIENWRQHYNKVRPHSSLGGRPPAPETKQPDLKVLAAS